MDNKQIVDGVDVSGCEHINTCDNKIKCVILQNDVCETNPYCGVRTSLRLYETN